MQSIEVSLVFNLHCKDNLYQTIGNHTLMLANHIYLYGKPSKENFVWSWGDDHRKLGFLNKICGLFLTTPIFFTLSISIATTPLNLFLLNIIYKAYCFSKILIVKFFLVAPWRLILLLYVEKPTCQTGYLSFYLYICYQTLSFLPEYCNKFS